MPDLLREHLPGTVMLVEDGTAIRTLQRFVLARTGLRVLEYADLPEAENALEHFTPGVIVLDLNLPSGNGLNLLTHINRSATKVVVMTSMAQEHVEERCEDAADAFLPKPFDPDIFIEVVQRLLPLAHA
ncbi:response regulator (plasmid) [Deinococcus radiomollis]|uniref:response regulator n=1 Tax=Deinococcus radiomollis TaxID=468916 RepID=UPI00389245FE